MIPIVIGALGMFTKTFEKELEDKLKRINWENLNFSHAEIFQNTEKDLEDLRRLALTLLPSINAGVKNSQEMK